VCDFDSFDVTNLNRQILSTRVDIGRMKTDIAARRIKAISPDTETVIYDFRLVGSYTSEHLELDTWDYVADAVDDVEAKVGLICSCREKGIPVISSMGAGNRLDPFRFRIADISKTHDDPLAKSVRKQLRERGVEGVKVLFSDEPPVKKGARPIPSISYMPAAAGLFIASEIIRDLIKNA
ncbi:MAG: ThiF family adenylyltransferase, partial [Firmicutes bacterium]|nr:ThiF family adenylyltransferase [Bacillota bacterium]